MKNKHGIVDFVKYLTFGALAILTSGELLSAIYLHIHYRLNVGAFFIALFAAVASAILSLIPIYHIVELLARCDEACEGERRLIVCEACVTACLALPPLYFYTAGGRTSLVGWILALAVGAPVLINGCGFLLSKIGRTGTAGKMRKVAIVGVEGSGKTVMLAGLGALYAQPDEKGYFLSPNNLETTAYVNRSMSILQSGAWPAATVDDVMQGLDWDLRRRTRNKQRPKTICRISFLDFAGEVYREAFAREKTPMYAMSEPVTKLIDYLSEADCVIVLVNLRDVIQYGTFSPRVEESVWITKAILEFLLPEKAVPGRKAPSRVAIALSQADSYENTIKACGGPAGTIRKYLPYVAANFGWLDMFAVRTVDKTVLDDDGQMVPAPDFTTKGLVPIMDWILDK